MIVNLKQIASVSYERHNPASDHAILKKGQNLSGVE